jgi:hypothetical protein
MANFGPALIAFGKFTGLLGTNGDVKWAWFLGPKASMAGTAAEADDNPRTAAQRSALGDLIKALDPTLTVDDDPDLKVDTSDPDYSFVRLKSVGPVEIGLAWNQTDPLEIGALARATFGATTPPIVLTIFAKMLGIGKGDINALLGHLKFAGTLPAPSFLGSISLHGEVPPPKTGSTIGLTVTGDVGPIPDAQNPNPPRVTHHPTLSLPAQTFAWDCVRMALFVVEAWVHKNAVNGTVLGRMNKHLFPMFGELPSSAIKTFPLFGVGTGTATDSTGQPPNMGQPPNFEPWRQSVLGGNVAGVVTFLWHLRALVTGDEGLDFFHGSLFMPFPGEHPVVSANPPDPSVTPPPFPPPPANKTTAWIGVTDDAAPNYRLVVDVWGAGASKPIRIPLADIENGALARPVLSATEFNAINSLPNGLIAPTTPITLKKGGTTQNPTVNLKFSTDLGTSPGPLKGTYGFEVILESGKQVRFIADLGGFSVPALATLALPPGSAPQLGDNDLMAAVVQWIIALTTPPATDPLSGVVQAFGDFVQAELKQSGSGDVVALLQAIVAPIGSGASIELLTQPPLDVAIGFPSSGSHLAVAPAITVGPFSPDDQPGSLVSIGNLTIGAKLDPKAQSAQSPLVSASLGIDDVRINLKNYKASGLVADLLPDLTQAPGFHLDFEYAPGASQPLTLTGGGKVPLQITLGPLALSGMDVEAALTETNGKYSGSFSIDVDLTFELSVITVSTYQLGVTYDFGSNTATPDLHGLGLAFDAGGISLSGLFLKSPQDDYLGTASVSVEDLFSLSAIGGYKQLADGKASLFIFAALEAALGGPPFLFVTGIAGGFGFNRSLPAPDLHDIDSHPFMQILAGGSNKLTGNAASDLIKLGTFFAPNEGDYWIAAGIKFLSFGFIEGKVIVTVAFGNDFSFDILGSAHFGLPPVAFFEIDVLVVADKDKFLLQAGISPNSYLVHPDIFSLQGDFALGEWHGGDYAGDFLLSIGGFHPCFKYDPKHYPTPNRVAVNANVFDFVHVSIQCFFSCTPQALMAGASVSLSAKFAGIAAGLDVYVDVLIQWDPFYLVADLGVVVWFEFCGRHEIGVELHIHTPQFGGLATIHLFIVSFDISFGDDAECHYPTIAQFFTKQLSVQATDDDKVRAQLPRFNAESAAGLLRVQFASLGGTGAMGGGSDAQEGLTTNTAVKVPSEFSLAVRTRLPFAENDPKAKITGPLSGNVDLPLCGKVGLTSTLTVTGADAEASGALAMANFDRLFDMFPKANFGPPLGTFQSTDAQPSNPAVAGVDTSTPALSLTDSLTISFPADPSGQPLAVNANGELSDSRQSYPLPFGAAPGTVQQPNVAVVPGPATVAAAAKLRRPRTSIGRRERARAMAIAPTIAPLQVDTTSAILQRASRAAAWPSTSVAAAAAGIPVMAVPASPARRTELAAVNLRILAPRTAAPAARRSILTRKPVPPVRATLPALNAPTTVVSGQAVSLDIRGGARPHASLAFEGQQTVRAIFLNAVGEPMQDRFVVGSANVALPAGARRAVLVGEGPLAGAPASLGALGIEPRTMLLALGGNTFAGHGCVLQTGTPVRKTLASLGSLPGADILSGARSIGMLFPPTSPASALLITIAPAVAQPAPAPGQVRWRSLDARLAGLKTVAGADHAAFVMDVAATQPWRLDIEVGRDWRLVSVALCGGTAADLAADLDRRADWNFVDDRMLQPAAPMSTKVTLGISDG